MVRWAGAIRACCSASLAIVAIYLCGLALFASQGPAIAAALIAFFNQMVFVQSRIAMLDIFALAFGLFAIAAFMHGFRKPRPHLWFALAGLGFGLSTACKWSGLFPLAICIVIVAAIRLMQGWRTHFADGNADDWYRPDLWPDFRYTISPRASCLIPAIVYLATFIPLYGLSLPDLMEAQRRIFADNTTTAIAGHTYMSAWPSWPFLVRPVWYLFDKIGDDRIAAVVFLGNPLVLWPALPALAICLRDWIVTRRRGCVPDPVVLFRALSRLGDAAARRSGFLYYYLPSATVASLALVYVLRRGNSPRWLLWAFVAIAVRGLCRDAADLGRLRRNVDGDLQPADAFPELDLSKRRSSRTRDPIPGIRLRSCEYPPAAGRQAGKRCDRHFDAVLVSMLTTWTRRLIGSIGAFGSFGLVLP